MARKIIDTDLDTVESAERKVANQIAKTREERQNGKTKKTEAELKAFIFGSSAK